MGDILLKAENITKGFPGVKALDGVHFELRKGEVHALLGENGAGKSTLMKIFSGIYQPDGGQLKMNGSPVTLETPKKAQSLGVGIIHQELNLCPHLTVAQNIFIGREFSSYGVLDQKRQNREAQRLLNDFQVDFKATDLVKDLSLSRQQMVEIIKVISMNAEVLIMDEPTSALSEKEIVTLMGVIRRLRDEGKGVIYISHRLEELKHIADRVTVFRDGTYVDTMVYKETNLEHMIGLMVGRKLEEKYPRVSVAPGKTILQAKGLGRATAVNDVSFELKAGEILGLAGLVGAGRTELGRLLFGADKRAGGMVEIDGQVVDIKCPADGIRHGIVYIPEDRKQDGLLLGMSVLKNTTLPSMADYSNRFGVIDSKKEALATEKICKDLRVKTPNIHQTIKNLSGGNQQKVVVGKWMLRNPRVFIFDEPTRGVDVGAKIEIYSIMNALKEKGIGVIVISSELPEIMGITDRVLVMCQGQIRASLDTLKTNQEEIMAYATQFCSAN